MSDVTAAAPLPRSLSVVGDALTMAGRGLRLSVRNLDALLTSLMLPVMLMVVFVYLAGPSTRAPPTSPTSCRECCCSARDSGPPPRR